MNKYGYMICNISGGLIEPDAKFAVCDPLDGEDGLYIECASFDEAEKELAECCADFEGQ